MYLKGRLSAIRHLSIYNLMSRLRSSKAALHEHLIGTEAAMQAYGLHDRVRQGKPATSWGNSKSYRAWRHRARISCAEFA